MAYQSYHQSLYQDRIALVAFRFGACVMAAPGGPQVTNPHGKRIYTTLQQTEDKFSFKARYAGRYQFCLTISNGNGLGVALGSGNR